MLVLENGHHFGASDFRGRVIEAQIFFVMIVGMDHYHRQNCSLGIKLVN